LTLVLLGKNLLGIRLADDKDSGDYQKIKQTAIDKHLAVENDFI